MFSEKTDKVITKIGFFLIAFMLLYIFVHLVAYRSNTDGQVINPPPYDPTPGTYEEGTPTGGLFETEPIVICFEDEPCWDCETMGNRYCGDSR